MTDESKAIEEVAKAAQKALDFFSKVVGAPLEEFSYAIQDWTKYYRFKNLIKIHDRVEEIYRSRLLQGKSTPLPPRLAIPLIEAASIEDDVTLQELWARLIANSTDPNKTRKLHPGYIEVIKQLTPDEAIIIDAFSKAEHYPHIFTAQVFISTDEDITFGTPLFFEGITKDYLELCSRLNLAHPKSEVMYLDNLKRLRLIEVGYNFDQSITDTPPIKLTGSQASFTLHQFRNEYMEITSFGDAFINACIRY